MTKPETCDRGVVCTPRTRCADHSNRDTVLAARQLRREQLAVLLSRAARGVLTPKEGPLLRAAVDTELADAEDAHRRAERAEQQAAAVRGECETWKAKAEEIERDRDRIATEHTEFVLKAGEQIGRAQADTELLRRTVRAECDAIEREQYGQHDEDADGMREAARRHRAALDAAGQPECPGETGR